MNSQNEDKITADFNRWISQDARLYHTFERITKKMIDRGFQHYSAKGIFEVMRWHVDMEKGPDAHVKLNNNYTSRLARMFEEKNPQHIGFFRKRVLRKASANSTEQAAND